MRSWRKNAQQKGIIIFLILVLTAFLPAGLRAENSGESFWFYLNLLYFTQAQTGQLKGLLVGTQEDVEKVFSLVAAFVARGETEEAGRMLARAKELAPGEEGTLAALSGELYLAQGDWERAEQAFQAALKADPKMGRAELGLAKIAAARGDWDTALMAYLEAEKLCENNLELYLGLGQVYRQKGELEKAAEKLNQGLKINPNWAPLYYELGEVRVMQGKIKEAEVAFTRAQQLDPTWTAPAAAIKALTPSEFEDPPAK